jgi:Cys-rich repeat protein
MCFSSAFFFSASCLLFCFFFTTTTVALIPYPYNNEYPHQERTIRVEGIVDLSGPFYTENTQNAVGWMIWRDWVNEKLGGLCLPQFLSNRQAGIDYLRMEKNDCNAADRYNVSMVLWDVMEKGSLADRLPLYVDYYNKVCNQTGDKIPHILLSPYTSTPASAAIQGVASHGMYGCNTIMAALASTPNLFNKGYKFMFTSFPSPVAIIQPLSLLITQKSKKVAILSKYGDLLADSLSTGLSNLLKTQQPDIDWIGFKCSGSATRIDGVNCKTNADCPSGQVCTYPQFQQSYFPMVHAFNLLQWVQYLKDLNPEIFVIAGHSADAISLMEAIRIVKWTPQMAITAYPISLSFDVSQAASTYWVGSSLLDAKMNFSSPSPELYMGNTPDYCLNQVAKAVPKYYKEQVFKAGADRIDDCFTPGLATAMLLVMQRVFRQAAALNGWSPLQNISRTTFDILNYHLYNTGYKKNNVSELCQSMTDPQCVLFSTFWGPFSLSTVGTIGLNSAKTSQPFQISQSGTTRFVQFLTSLFDNLFYPAKWDWIIQYEWFQFSKPSLNGIYCLIALVILITLVSAVFVVKYRKHGVIKGSTVFFLLIIHFAAVFVSLSSLSFTWEATTATCFTRRWWLSFFLFLFLLPILIKTYRIVKIFKSEKLKIKVITLSDLTKHLMICMFFVLAAMCISEFTVSSYTFTSFDDVQKTKVENCSLNVPFTGTMISFLFVCGLITAFLAYKARDLDDKFNEYQHISFMLLIAICYSVIVVPIVFLFDSIVTAQLLTRVLGINFGILISLSALMIPKFQKIYVEYDTLYTIPNTLKNSSTHTSAETSPTTKEHLSPVAQQRESNPSFSSPPTLFKKSVPIPA